MECNKARLWLKGALDVANPLLESDPWVLGQMFMERLPETAPVWLGAIILGLQRKFVKQASFGQIPVNMNAAAWPGTVQSFLQEPLSGRCHESGWISRADERRLLFLAQADDHSQAPVCQWAPFGATAIKHTEIEVRIHKDCNGHTLQYDGFICTVSVASLSSNNLPRQPLVRLIRGLPPHPSSSNVPLAGLSEHTTVPSHGLAHF